MIRDKFEVESDRRKLELEKALIDAIHNHPDKDLTTHEVLVVLAKITASRLAYLERYDLELLRKADN